MLKIKLINQRFPSTPASTSRFALYLLACASTKHQKGIVLHLLVESLSVFQIKLLIHIDTPLSYCKFRFVTGSIVLQSLS